MFEPTKTEKRQMNDLLKRGILRRCEEWLSEMRQLIDKEYEDDENPFDRCMAVTKRSRDYYKEAMQREDCYRSSKIIFGIAGLFRDGYLTEADLNDLNDELRTHILGVIELMSR